MKKQKKMTIELAGEVTEAYLECKNKTQIEKQFHLSSGYGLDKALYMTGHKELCSNWFLRTYGSKAEEAKPLAINQDTTYEEWVKKNIDFQLELLARAERTIIAETRCAELEDRHRKLVDSNKDLANALRVSDEQKLKWEILAKRTNAESGRD